jgi:hypothetical protein
MATDLETLRTEIQEYLDQSKLGVFHGYGSLNDRVSVYWDIERHPDFRGFIQAAEKAGAKLVVFYHQQFSLDQVDDVLEEIEDSDLTREEKRNLENRVREVQKYEGFTCGVELSFSSEGRVYLYQQRTEWYQNWEDILSELDAAVDEESEDEDSGPIAGYFSNN